MLNPKKFLLFFIFSIASCKSAQPNLTSDVTAINQRNWSAFADKSTFLGGGNQLNNYSGFYPVHKVTGSENIGNMKLKSAHPSHFSSVSILKDGLDTFRARIHSLETAKESIRIQSLIFTGDESGLMVANLLKKKFIEFRAKFKKEFILAGYGPLDADNRAFRKAQSRIRVVIDQVSSLDFRMGNFVETRNMLFMLKATGIEVQGYENLLGGISNEICVRDILCPNKRPHEKLWVIDAETPYGLAIVGGSNIANEYFRADIKNPKMYWWDQDVVLKGSVVADVATAFDKNFAEEDRQYDVLNSFFDAFLSIKWSITRVINDEIKLHYSPKPKNEFVEKYLKQALPMEAKLKFYPSTVRYFNNRPKFKETFIEQLYMKSIQDAKSEILINNAYFIPSKAMVKSLTDAVRRGVNVKIIVNSPDTNDLPEITYLGRVSYLELLSVNLVQGVHARMEIYEWTGNDPSDSQKEGTNHAKFAIFDRELSIVGSYNLDPRSRNLNSESVIAYQSLPLGIELGASFKKLLKKTNLINKYSTDRIQQFITPTDAEYKKRLDRARWLENFL